MPRLSFPSVAICGLMILLCALSFASGYRACVCPKIWWPVCGNNGFTYGNRCEFNCARAQREGISIFSSILYTWVKKSLDRGARIFINLIFLVYSGYDGVCGYEQNLISIPSQRQSSSHSIY